MVGSALNYIQDDQLVVEGWHRYAFNYYGRWFGKYHMEYWPSKKKYRFKEEIWVEEYDKDDV